MPQFIFQRLSSLHRMNPNCNVYAEINRSDVWCIIHLQIKLLSLQSHQQSTFLQLILQIFLFIAIFQSRRNLLRLVLMFVFSTHDCYHSLWSYIMQNLPLQLVYNGHSPIYFEENHQRNVSCWKNHHMANLQNFIEYPRKKNSLRNIDSNIDREMC